MLQQKSPEKNFLAARIQTKNILNISTSPIFLLCQQEPFIHVIPTSASQISPVCMLGQQNYPNRIQKVRLLDLGDIQEDRSALSYGLSRITASSVFVMYCTPDASTGIPGSQMQKMKRKWSAI